MAFATALSELEAAGTVRNRAIYRRDGETGCGTPDAVLTIEKAEAREGEAVG